MKILSRPKGNAEEYGRWSVNPYVGCPHGCSYCYLKKGVWAKELGGNVPRLKKGIANDEHAFHVAMAEIIANRDEIIRDGGLFMSFVTDPCAHETRELMFHITAIAIEQGIPVTMLTKNADFFQYSTMEGMINDAKHLMSRPDYGLIVHNGMMFCTWLGDLRKDLVKRLVSFGWTLTGHDELEPNASTNEERIATMKRMSDEGYKTWASIEPVIDFQSSYRMVCQALRAGCKHFKIGLLTSNTKPCREKYDVHDSLDFILNVMVATEGKATVYWKQSVREFIRTCRKPTLTDEELHKVFDTWKHSVGKG